MVTNLVKALNIENRREKILQDMKIMSTKGIPFVIFGKAQYGTMVENYLKSLGMSISDVFMDDIAGSKDILNFEDIKTKYKEFIVIIGFYRSYEIIEEKMKKYECKQMKAWYYLDFPFPIDGTFIGWDFLQKYEKQFDDVYNLLSNTKSRELLTWFLGAKICGDSKVLKPYFSENPYFTSDIVKLSDEEIIVDCGAYIGDTLSMFASSLKIKYKKYYALEPDIDNFTKLKKYIEDNNFKNVITLLKGVWNESGELRFHGERSSDSSIKLDGKTVIQVDKIDNFASDATFIKMDIEGSELKALQGAQETIKNNRPKLAICVYHKCKDLFEIPLFIHSIMPDYKLYLGLHESSASRELVLYAMRGLNFPKFG